MSRDYAVRIHLPPSEDIDRSILRSFLPQVLVEELGRAGKSWPERGWNNPGDFHKELFAGIDATDTDGIVVARAQNEEDAKTLAERLGHHTASAVVEHDPNPMMRTDVGPPPKLGNGNIFGDDEMPVESELQAPHDPRPAYSVLIHAPDDAPPLVTNERARWLIDWFVEGNRAPIQTMLGRAYRPGLGVRTRDFTWPDRGWDSEDHFRIHVGVVIRDNDTAVVARGQSYKEALFLSKRLEKMGIKTSLSSPDQSIIVQYGLTAYPDESSAEAAYSDFRGSGMGGRRGQSGHDLLRLGQELGLSPQVLSALSSGDERAMHALAAAVQSSVSSGRPPEEVHRFMEGLRQHVEQEQKNKSSGTKRDVLDNLPKIIMTEDTRTAKGDSIPACAVCTEELAVGDEITCLPCGHYFHRGTEPDATATTARKMEGGTLLKTEDCCGGVLAWLKDNHDCPVCRTELEAEVSPEMLKANPAWNCPICRSSVTAGRDRCRCGCKRIVLQVAQGLLGPVLRETESLFFKCYEYAQRRNESDPGKNMGPEEEALSREIDALIGSSGVAEAIGRGWEITVGIENLLLSALRGDSDIQFHAGDVDVNSRGVLSVLFNKIKERMGQTSSGEIPPDSGNGPSVVTSSSHSASSTDRPYYSSASDTSSKPRAAAKSSSMQLCICPLCDGEMADDRCLPCGVHTTAIFKANELKTTFFNSVKELFFKLVLSRSPMMFRAEVEALLDGEEILNLVKGGWELNGGVSKLLRAAMNGEMKFKFQTAKGIDPNSRAMLGCLFHHLREGLAECPQAHTAGVEIEKPYLPEEESLAFTTRRFPLQDKARGFLTESIEIFRRIVDILVEGGSDEEWDYIRRCVFPRYDASGWRIVGALKMMRSGVRDLGTLTAGIDSNSASVVEVLLGMVSRKENAVRQSSAGSSQEAAPAFATTSSASPVAHGLSVQESSNTSLGPSLRPQEVSQSTVSEGGSELTRQPSHGTRARGELISLRQRLLHSYKDILKVLETLQKLLKNIIREPTARKFRCLKLENALVKETIIEQVEIVDILKSVGFRMTEEVFELPLVDRECLNNIQRVIIVVEEEMRDIHEEWSSLYG